MLEPIKKIFATILLSQVASFAGLVMLRWAWAGYVEFQRLHDPTFPELVDDSLLVRGATCAVLAIELFNIGWVAVAIWKHGIRAIATFVFKYFGGAVMATLLLALQAFRFDAYLFGFMVSMVWLVVGVLALVRIVTYVVWNQSTPRPGSGRDEP